MTTDLTTELADLLEQVMGHGTILTRDEWKAWHTKAETLIRKVKENATIN